MHSQPHHLQLSIRRGPENRPYPHPPRCLGRADRSADGRILAGSMGLHAIDQFSRVHGRDESRLLGDRDVLRPSLSLRRAALGFLNRGRNRHLLVWCVILVFVIMQMTTTLRPILGESDRLTVEKEKKVLLCVLDGEPGFRYVIG